MLPSPSSMPSVKKNFNSNFLTFSQRLSKKNIPFGKTTTFWSKTGVPDWTKIRRQIMTLRQDVCNYVIDCVIISDPVHYHVRGDRNSCTFGAPSPAGPFWYDCDEGQCGRVNAAPLLTWRICLRIPLLIYAIINCCSCKCKRNSLSPLHIWCT